MPKLLGNNDVKSPEYTSPFLLDNSNTPRGAKRAITLERNFDTFAWMYNRKHGDSLKVGSDTITKDKEKSKVLKKLIKSKKRSIRRGSGSPRNSMMGSSKGHMA
jgi:hypothetical protein